MVLFALREYPQTQEQIIRTILETWDTTIERKAVGRHLQLLQDLGFPVQHRPEGYLLDGEPCTPDTDICYGPSAYPLLILQVLDGTPKQQAQIIREIQAKYGSKIGRTALCRHLALLQTFGISIQKTKIGYIRK